MRTYGQLALSVVFATTFMGCASIIDGTKQTVTFNSDPKGSEVVIDGVTKGVTPFSVTLKRKSDVVAWVKHEGYQDQQVTLHTEINPWFWGNILTGGLIGSTTDGISGAVHEYDPDNYYITLTPLDSSQIEKDLLRKKMWARVFVLSGYSHIAADLAKGGGEYLASLYDVLGLHESSRDEGFPHLRQLFLQHRDKPSVAEALVDSYLPGGGS